MYNAKGTGHASAMPTGIAVGTTAALGCTFIFSALLTFLLSKTTIPQEAVGYWIMAVLAVSSAIGAVVSYHKIKHRKVLTYFLSSGIYLLCLISLTALFFGGVYEGVVPTMLIVFGGSGGAYLMSVRKKQKGNISRHSSHFC